MPKVRSRINIVFLIVAVLLTAVVVAFGVYWRQNLVTQDQEAKNEVIQNDLRQQVNALQDQLTALQQQLNPSSPVVPVSAEGQRILLSQANIEQYRPKDQTACQEKFVTDLATGTVTYLSQKIDAGLTVDLPYNSNWGNEKYQISPFEEVVTQKSTGLVFGPLAVLADCSWVRSQQIIFGSAQSATATLASLQKNASQLVGKPKQVVIGSITAIKYQIAGALPSAAYQVIGPKYNYEFSQPCEKKTVCTESFSQLEKIIKSIKFLTPSL
jgi:cytoskeletal protein RodZ